MKTSIHAIIYLALIVLGSNTAQALSPRDYTLQLSPATRDLTQQSIRNVFQDSRGFIWILTQEGLHRYDGYSVTRYRASNQDPYSISHQSTTDIVEDSEGFLWVATAGGGLNRYDPATHKFTSLQSSEISNKLEPLSNNIYTLFKDKEGFVWLGYETGAGFSRFSPNDQTFEHFPPDISAKQTRAVSFAETSNGNLWILIDGLGILQLDNDRNFSKVINIPSHDGAPTSINRFSHLLAASDGNLWISSLDTGLTRYNPNTGNFSHFRSDSERSSTISDNTVYMTIEDQSKNIWVATRSGVSVWEPATKTFTWINASNSNIPDNQVFSIYQSSAGIIWIGTFNGLAYGTKSLFARIDSELGAPGDSINSFAQDDSGLIWIGSNSGIYTYDPNTDSTGHYKPAIEINNLISSQRVMSLLVESGTLWVGTLDSGLNRVGLTAGEVEVFKKRVSIPKSLKANGITSIVRTSDGELLVGTYGGGLSILDEKTGDFFTYMHDSEDLTTISSNNVIAILQDSNSDVWIGTENGLNLFERETGTFSTFTSDLKNPDSLSSNLPWALHEANSGTLWIGTQSGGLNAWKKNNRAQRKNKFVQYLEDIDLPSADIYAITTEDNGNVWMSHNRGLTRFSPRDNSTENYDLSDGLQGTEFNHGAVFRDSSSRLYFGGNNGFNIIDPKNLTKNVYQPPLQITEFRILNEEVVFDVPVSEKKEIWLDYNFRYASFTFASLDYTNPTSNLYRYMLDGFDKEWIELGNSRSVSFTSLPAGKYEFRLQGSNSDGVWNPQTLSFSLMVKPAPWFSPIAYIVYAIATLAIIAAIADKQRARTLQTIARQRELEQKVNERTVDLEEARNAAERANRAKSDFLATVTHEIRTPLHGIIGMTELLQHTSLSDQQKKYADAAHSSGESLLDLINSILDLSKIEANRVEVEETEFDLIKILDEICYIQSEAATRKSVCIYYEVDENMPQRLIGDPTKIRQVVTNLFSNAIKFTDEGSITLNANWTVSPQDKTQGTLSIEVRDTGIGIEESAKERLFQAFTQADASTTRRYGGTGLGLAISKNFVDIMSGELQLESSLGVGTTFRIKLPLGDATFESKHNVGLYSIPVTFFAKNPKTIKASLGHIRRNCVNVSTCTDENEALTRENPQGTILIDVDNFDTEQDLVNFLSLSKSKHKILLSSFIFDAEPFKNYVDGVVTKPLTTIGLKQSLFANQIKSKSLASTEPADRADAVPRPRVLIAEDLETNQKIATAIFELFGCVVTVADNGLDAVEKFEKSEFEAIFMDCQMPVMDGYEATCRIRQHEELTDRKRTPIIALTASNSADEMRRGLSAGMDQYLTKPFKMDEIKLALEKHGVQLKKQDQHSKIIDLQPKLSESVASEHENLVINTRALESIFEVERQTGSTVLHKLLEGYERQMSEKIEDLRNSLLKSDNKAIYSAAHAIKSMSSNMGAEQVRLISSHLEKSAKNNEIVPLDGEVEELEVANQEFLAAIKIIAARGAA